MGKKRNSIFPKGVAAKVIWSVVITFLVMAVEIVLLLGFSLQRMSAQVRTEGEHLTRSIEDHATEAIDHLIKNGLEDLAVRAADKTDDELWVNEYELSILGSMVADVIEHPENYGRVPVYPPSMENAGKKALQVMSPNGFENIPSETMEKLERLANLAPIMASYIGQYTIDIYVSLPDGTTLAMDSLSEYKFDENGKEKLYDASTRPWFYEAVEKGGTRFGPAEPSFFYDFDIVVYSAPVYVNGELVAVMEGTLRPDRLRDRVGYVLLGETGFNVLIADTGQLVSTSRDEGELAMRKNYLEDIRATVNPDLARIIEKGLSGESGAEEVEVDGERYYVGYGPLVTVGWTQLSFVSADETMAPVGQMVEETTLSSKTMQARFKQVFRRMLPVILLSMFIIFTLSNIVVSLVTKKIVDPVNLMTRRIREISGEDRIFEMEDAYKTGDEIETLARSFSEQSERLSEYMDENLRITAEKERVDAELSTAKQIQETMLPKTKPVFSDRPQYDLFARAVPAKDVGGDFYDFFKVDDDHLAIVMADVSGKGITAALFMALSKQVIQSMTLINNGEVTEALNMTNIRLLEESLPDMFVTVWLGVITLSTGHLSFVDAGHEYPAIQREGGSFSIEKDVHSMPVAALKRAKYMINELELKPGDTIVLYTDGVTEARNMDGDMFGEQRLKDALNEAKDFSLDKIDEHVRKRISEFVGEAEQYDDITTLCFKYLG